TFCYPFLGSSRYNKESLHFSDPASWAGVSPAFRCLPCLRSSYTCGTYCVYRCSYRGRSPALASLVHKTHNLHNDLRELHRHNRLTANCLCGRIRPKSSTIKFVRICIAAGIALFAGCGQHDQIASYTVAKPELVDPTLVAKTAPAPATATEQQTIGLIVP